MGKPSVLFLLRNAYFVIGTALLRARFASGMCNAPTGGGGKDFKKSKAIEIKTQP
jgi:hypothetical protein